MVTNQKVDAAEESFAQLLEEEQGYVGSDERIVNAKVLRIGEQCVILDANCKSEALVPRAEFEDAQGNLEIKEGDLVKVGFETTQDRYGHGETLLSRTKAKRNDAWEALERAYAQDEPVEGVVSERVKGGFSVMVDNVLKAFLPGSLAGSAVGGGMLVSEGQAMGFKVVKMDRKRSNVVLSRRAYLNNDVDRAAFLDSLEEGKVIKGVVKNLTKYGAFVDLEGVMDGLLHVYDMAWHRLEDPSEVVSPGEEIEVVVLRFDKEKNRVSLGLKQLTEDPWVQTVSEYPIGTRFVGKVTNVTDYGCFVTIGDKGIQGLAHNSEMSWTNKNIHPTKVVEVEKEIEVMVLDVDEKRRRISLGIKQCQRNPWQTFGEKFKKGDRLTGTIKSITDFGLFIGVGNEDDDIDGLVHLKDISSDEAGEKAIRHYKKGDVVDVVVLAIDPERERISLGIKQIGQANALQLIKQYPKGKAVSAKVVDANDKQVNCILGDKVTAFLKRSELENPDARFVEGDTIEAYVANVDKKQSVVMLTLNNTVLTQEALRSVPNPTATLGDLLQEELLNSAVLRGGDAEAGRDADDVTKGDDVDPNSENGSEEDQG